MTTSVSARVMRLVRRLGASRDGNVAIIFAIAVIPIIAFVGAAIDFGRASSIKAAMQSALDATALAMSKDAANVSSGTLQTNASAYFAAQFNRPEAQNVNVTISYSSTGGSSVVVTGSATIPTRFMGILGFYSLNISSSATTKWGMGKLRVALVLDNSGSMADSGKLSALKTAAKQLLTTLKNASPTAGDVQVAIVPFNNVVNVGSNNYTQNWIDWDDWEADNGHWDYNWSGRTWVHDNHNTWNGCVVDRDQDNDVKNTTPTSSSSTQFPAAQADYCPTSLVGLNYNWTSLNSKIDAMDAEGATNQPIGLVWGWHALSQGAPLNAPAITDNVTQQVIILLSDGLNTQDRWYGNGHDPSSQVDARMTKVCTNAKAAGVVIYTILVMAGNSTVLQNCASSASKYFALTTAGQIITTFNSIGSTLSKLRIAK